MHEVIEPGRVKVVYMRAVGRVHPDKLPPPEDGARPPGGTHPPTVGTEERMVAANVFATLNEAWERFRGENGM